MAVIYVGEDLLPTHPKRTPPPDLYEHGQRYGLIRRSEEATPMCVVLSSSPLQNDQRLRSLLR
jgi:hypothetical protein